MRRSVEGIYHPEQSSRSIAARLEAVADGGSLRIVDAGGAVLCTILSGEAKLSSHVAGVPRRLELTGGAVFVTEDNEGLERATAEIIARPAFNVARLERPTILLFVIGIATIVGLLALARFGIPLVAKPLAKWTPHAVTQAAGAGTLRSLDRTLLSPTKLPEDQRKRLRAGFEAVVQAAGVEGRPRLNFRSSPIIGPNAFALMGGHIVATDQLVEFLDDEEQVMAILAHELAHASHLHVEQKLWRVAGTGLVLMLLIGDAGTLIEELTTLGYGLAELKNSREHEAEADRGAVTMMIKAGKDPSALAAAMQAFKRLCGKACDSGWLSTHPGLDDRVDAICAAIPQGRPVRAVCKR